jgi:UDP-4-amino-4,6-dideoxy-N-acetyl-beta-L-altrosamine N-acetyltransferase
MNLRTRLRPLVEADLDMLLGWRNSDHVRRFMYSSHLIVREEHRCWYETIRADDGRYPLIFEREDTPAGFVNLGPVQAGGIAAWGFYAAPSAPRGTGRMLAVAALAHAFGKLQLHKICGEALGFNETSRRFHLSLGFRQEGVLVDQHFDGTAYHDVVRFGLTAMEWQVLNRENSHETNP